MIIVYRVYLALLAGEGFEIAILLNSGYTRGMFPRLHPFLAWDQRITARLQLKPNHPAWKLAAFLAHSGDSWFWAAGMALVWLLTRGEWHTRAGLLESAIICQALAVFVMKRRIRRPRPAGEWGGVYRQIDPHSFPSGHATRAWMLVTLAVGLGPAWLVAVLLVWSPGMSLARVATGVHYVSDILGGAILGILFGLLTLALAPWGIAWLPFLFY